jgi:hypothetical protein
MEEHDRDHVIHNPAAWLVPRLLRNQLFADESESFPICGRLSPKEADVIPDQVAVFLG